MPDSQVPPLWGPAYDERDLDALLSGETGSIPLALRPVQSTLAALRVAATGRELSGEAAARAAFRAFAPAPVPVPWTAAPPAPAPVPWRAQEPATVTAHTLILRAADERRPARHRHRRPAARGARKPRIAVTSVAAAALIVAAVAVTGTLTGSIGKLTSFGHQPARASASARAAGQSSRPPQVLGSAKPTPDPTLSATAPSSPRATSGPGSLCREFFGYYFEHPGQRGGTAQITLGRELSTLAGGRFKVFGYCLRYLDPSWDKAVSPPGGDYPGYHGTRGLGNPGPANLGTGSQGSGTGGQRQGGDPGAGSGFGGVGGSYGDPRP